MSDIFYFNLSAMSELRLAHRCRNAARLAAQHHDFQGLGLFSRKANDMRRSAEKFLRQSDGSYPYIPTVNCTWGHENHNAEIINLAGRTQDLSKANEPTRRRA